MFLFFIWRVGGGGMWGAFVKSQGIKISGQEDLVTECYCIILYQTKTNNDKFFIDGPYSGGGGGGGWMAYQ